MANYGLNKIHWRQAGRELEKEQHADQKAKDMKQIRQYKMDRLEDAEQERNQQKAFEAFQRDFHKNFGDTYQKLLRGEASPEEKTEMMRWMKMDPTIEFTGANKEMLDKSNTPGIDSIGTQEAANKFVSRAGEHGFGFQNDRELAEGVKGVLQSKDAWTQEMQQNMQEWRKPKVYIDPENGEIAKMTKAQVAKSKEQGNNIMGLDTFAAQKKLDESNQANFVIDQKESGDYFVREATEGEQGTSLDGLETQSDIIDTLNPDENNTNTMDTNDMQDAWDIVMKSNGLDGYDRQTLQTDPRLKSKYDQARSQFHYVSNLMNSGHNPQTALQTARNKFDNHNKDAKVLGQSKDITMENFKNFYNKHRDIYNMDLESPRSVLNEINETRKANGLKPIQNEKQKTNEESKNKDKGVPRPKQNKNPEQTKNLNNSNIIY